MMVQTVTAPYPGQPEHLKQQTFIAFVTTIDRAHV
jgi:hypothetical protein